MSRTSENRSVGARRAGWVVLCAPLLAALGCGGDGAASDTRPDIVLVVIDTLRPDHLSSYGYERETAPFLADLARRSTVFERAFSTSSWTAPSTASIFTGLYPNQHGVVAGFRMESAETSPEERRERRAGRTAAELRDLREEERARPPRTIEFVGLSGDLATLPERLSRAGYRTFGVASNINIGAELGFSRGFDEFERLHVADAEGLFERLLSWRDELQAPGPSFLYLHLNDVHKPYQRRAPWFEPSEDPLANWIAKYDSEISYLDQALGGLAAELNWGPETVILVVSDHGEEFMDHGDMGHKFSLHYELNRVLMLLHAPRAGEGTEPAADDAGRGGRSTANVSLVDVMPTLLEVAGLAPDPDAPGRSLLALAAGEDAAYFDERTLFAHRLGGEGEHLWAAIRGDWKVIHEPAAEATSLFDIGRDSAETDDLSGSHAAVAADLEGRLERFRAQFPIRTGQVTEVQVDGDLFEHLKRLGYVDGD